MRLLILIIIAFGTYIDAKARIREERNLNYCHVREKENSYTFQFQELKTDKDYIIEHKDNKNVSLRLQICEPLKQSCNGVEGFSICLNKDGKEIGIGKDPPQVISDFKEIIFKYTGDPCKNGQNYSASIKMICDYGVKNGPGIGLFAADPDDCDFNMQWNTKAACPPGERKKVKCNVNDNFGQHYDLEELINDSDNYEVVLKEFSVILNVCHPIVYRKNACKTTNAACLITKDGKSLGLGEPTEDLKYNSDGSLSLTYTNGMICDHANSHTQFINRVQTTITFFCDLNATESLPKYTGGKDVCHYQFNWYTASACSEQALRKKSEKMNNYHCSVRDPITDQVFNLTALINREFVVKPFSVSNGGINFTVCGTLKSTACKGDAGICKVHNKTSGGIGNSKLLWKESGPYLNYTNGDRCYNNQQRYTLIEFYCGEENYDIEEEKDLCFDIIKFSTLLVCKHEKKCASIKNEINLSQLKLEDYNYVMQMNNTKYHINVCRSLVPDGLNCSHGAAICKITNYNGKEIPINLGFFDESPEFIPDTSAVLRYKNGSTCEEDKKRKIESIISFLCDIHSELGFPRLKKYENCMYYFEWKTKIVCGRVDGILKNHVINNSLGDVRDLSELTKSNGPILNVKNSQGLQAYKISFFDDKTDCNGAFVCDDKIHYGTEVSVLYDYNVNNVQFSFTNGSKCGDDVAKATLTIICKEENTVTSPYVLEEKSCNVEFEWLTSAICITQNSINVASSTEKTVFPYSKELIIGIVILILLILVVLMYYLINASRRSRFLDMINKSNGRHGERVKYSRVNTEEEVHLLLNTSDSAAVESDSDDDLLGD